MKRIYYVTTSPLIVNFFLAPHLAHLARTYRTSLAVTLPGEAPLCELPGVEVVPVEISRKIDARRDLAALVHSFGPKAGLLAAWAGAAVGVPARLHTFTGQIWAARARSCARRTARPRA